MPHFPPAFPAIRISDQTLSKSCEKIIDLGYIAGKRVNLYGEHFEIPQTPSSMVIGWQFALSPKMTQPYEQLRQTGYLRDLRTKTDPCQEPRTPYPATTPSSPDAASHVVWPKAPRVIRVPRILPRFLAEFSQCDRR